MKRVYDLQRYSVRSRSPAAIRPQDLRFRDSARARAGRPFRSLFGGGATWSSLPLAVLGALLGLVSSSPGQEISPSARSSAIKPSLLYDGAGFTNLSGGLRRASTYTGNLNLDLTVDFERLVDGSAMLFYIDGVWIHGGQPSDLAGDAQGLSNIAAPRVVQVEELWLQKNFPAQQLSFLAGLYELNNEFDVAPSAGIFINSSFAIGPEFSMSGRGGPSTFPATSVGLRLEYDPAPNLVLRAAVLDGVPYKRPDGTHAVFQSGDGVMLVSEIAVSRRPGPTAQNQAQGPSPGLGRFSNPAEYDDKFAFGVWHYTGGQEDLSEVRPDGRPVRHLGSSGAYLVADCVLSRDPADREKRTAAFLQLGLGDSRNNRFESYVGAGVVGSGYWGRPASDQIGLGVALARNSSHYLDSQQRGGTPKQFVETALEFTYQTQITPWLSVQPDLQYIIHPNTDPNVRNAVALTLHFQIALGR